MLELGFRPVWDAAQPYGFDVERTVPCDRSLRHWPQHLDNTLLQALLRPAVQALRAAIPGLGETVAFDVKHIYAWGQQNNLKAYVPERYDPTRQPRGDPDCRPGVKTSSNQPQANGTTPGRKEYVWGYGSGSVYARLSAERTGLFGSVTARAAAQVLRLSLVYAALDCSEIVRPAHLQAALAFWQYCDDSARHIFGDATGDRVADRILDALRGTGADGLDVEAISNLFSHHVSANRRDAALRLLEDAGLVFKRVEPTEGRNRTVYVAAIA